MDAGAVGDPPRAWRGAAGYAAACLACVALLCWLYGLPGRDLRLPMVYDGDGLDALLHGKLIVEQGWPLSHPGLGAPHGLTLHDFQRAETLQFGLLWLLALGTNDPFLLINLYYLATFPLAALVCLAVLRRLGVGYPAALVAALLFAFLPYHHHRGVTHLFLSGYFVVPLGALLALWAWAEEPLFSAGRRVTPRGLAALALAVIVGSVEVYYAFFTCFLLAAASAARCWRHRRWSAGAAPAALAGVIGLTVAVNLAPTLAFTLRHGPNAEAVRRGRVTAQLYDFRVSQMLAPTTGHRIGVIARAKALYNAHLPACTENDMASLGVVASVGLLYLLGRLLVPGGGLPPFHDAAVRLTGATVLLATMGGFGSVFTLAFPFIRAYNRASVFVAFFALFAVAALLDRLLARWQAGAVGRCAGLASCLALVAVGAWEQTPAFTARVSPEVDERFTADREFVRQVEERLSPGGMVLQLPLIAYPEGRGYDHLRLTLHARGSRWSFPAMRGRASDLWQKQLSTLDASEFLRRVRAAGFTGLTCDHGVSTPEEACREEQLRGLLGPPDRTSPDGRFAFYDLAGHAAADARGR